MLPLVVVFDGLRRWKARLFKIYEFVQSNTSTFQKFDVNSRKNVWLSMLGLIPGSFCILRNAHACAPLFFS